MPLNFLWVGLRRGAAHDRVNTLFCLARLLRFDCRVAFAALFSLTFLTGNRLEDLVELSSHNALVNLTASRANRCYHPTRERFTMFGRSYSLLGLH